MHFRGDIFNVVCQVQNPDVIAGIVPRPLAHDGEGIRVALIVVKELKAGFPEGFPVWNELSIQIPMKYEGGPTGYIGEIYSDDIKSIIFDREVFGLPRVPGRVSVERVRAGQRRN